MNLANPDHYPYMLHRTCIFTWNLFVLYFGASTLQNKAFSYQNKGHLGSRFAYMWLKFMVDVGKYSNPMEHLVIRFESPKGKQLKSWIGSTDWSHRRRSSGRIFAELFFLCEGEVMDDFEGGWKNAMVFWPMSFSTWIFVEDVFVLEGEVMDDLVVFFSLMWSSSPNMRNLKNSNLQTCEKNTGNNLSGGKSTTGQLGRTKGQSSKNNYSKL